MRRAAVFFKDREAILVNGRRLTFAQAWERGLRMANFLRGLGLQPGDRVGVLENNSLEAVDLFLGAAAANLVRVPLYPRNSQEAHFHMLRITECKVAIVSEPFAGELEGVRKAVPGLRDVIVRGADYESLLAAQSAADPDPPIRPDDLFIIRFTGGTTGLPRAVSYTHWAWLAAGRDWYYAWPPLNVGDAYLHVGPISHGSGYLFVPAWIAGGRNILVQEFDAEAVLDLIEKEKVGYSFMVSTMLNLLVRSPTANGRDYSSLKVINVGAAPIADDTVLRAQAVFGQVLYQAYGQTEALPATMSPPQDWIIQREEGRSPIRSAGRPLPFAEIEIRDVETHEVLPLGSEGEIAVRTDAQMTGYWRDEASTRERMIDGWVLTGDVGLLSEDGYLYILDRKDDMIISGGFNIWPAELENVLLEHPDVNEAAVFGVPHDKWGETPAAVCAVAEGAKVTESELIELCASRLGSYKKPSLVVLRSDPLPKSPVGKVMRKSLRAPYWAGRARRVAGA
jgi:acyl-CoA synthetase (AMP-forming)/AMP-acid ligase II